MCLIRSAFPFPEDFSKTLKSYTWLPVIYLVTVTEFLPVPLYFRNLLLFGVFFFFGLDFFLFFVCFSSYFGFVLVGWLVLVGLNFVCFIFLWFFFSFLCV